MTQSVLRLLVVGAGDRGWAYIGSLNHLDWVQVTGIAEPSNVRLQKLKKFCLKEFVNPPEEISEYNDWQGALNDSDKFDGVLVCVQDAMHKEVAVPFANKGKHLLCEKPLATSWQDCQDIINAVEKNNVILAIGHVLRYSPHNIELKRLVDSGIIGDIININHTEPVGWYHFAHSYVRGNWRKEEESTFALMAKCCHDIDVLLWLLGSDKIQKVNSFGGLSFFTKKNKPELAGDAKNCLECPAESECAFSAKKIYYNDFVTPGKEAWKTATLTDIEDEPHLLEAIKTGPYGKCVFECDNDVCDHQTVNLDFGNATATMTMISLSEEVCFRKMSLYGTKGEINTDSRTIKIFNFNTQETKTIVPPVEINSGHGGGDKGLATSFVSAVQDVLGNNRDIKEAQLEHIKCTPQEVLQSHKVVFLAEQARKQSNVQSINEKIL